MRQKDRVVVYSSREIALLIGLVSTIDPETIDGKDVNETRSLIYKAKSHVVAEGDGYYRIPAYRIEG